MNATDQERLYIEEFGLYFERMGLNRTAGRIFAWLMICDPPRQTLDELVAALGMSKSTISTAARALEQIGMVERISIPGVRPDYYRVPAEFWVQQAFDLVILKAGEFVRLGRRGLDVLAGAPPERRQRLDDMVGIYAFVEREFPKLIAAWEAEQRGQGE